MSQPNEPYFSLKIESETEEGRRVYALTLALQTFTSALSAGDKMPADNATLIRRADAFRAFLANGEVPGGPQGGEVVPVPGGSDELNKIVDFNRSAFHPPIHTA